MASSPAAIGRRDRGPVLGSVVRLLPRTVSIAMTAALCCAACSQSSPPPKEQTPAAAPAMPASPAPQGSEPRAKEVQAQVERNPTSNAVSPFVPDPTGTWIATDVNGDRKADIISIASCERVDVYFGLGDGNFTKGPTIRLDDTADTQGIEDRDDKGAIKVGPTCVRHAASVAVTDVDGDGRADVIVAYYVDKVLPLRGSKGRAVALETWKIAISRGDGKGSFLAPAYSQALGVEFSKSFDRYMFSEVAPMVVGNFRCAGVPDIVLSGTYLENDGHGRFSARSIAGVRYSRSEDGRESATTGAAGLGFPPYRSAAVADLNGDKCDDLLLRSWEGGSYYLLVGDSRKPTIATWAAPKKPHGKALNKRPPDFRTYFFGLPTMVALAQPDGQSVVVEVRGPNSIGGRAVQLQVYRLKNQAAKSFDDAFLGANIVLGEEPGQDPPAMGVDDPPRWAVARFAKEGAGADGIAFLADLRPGVDWGGLEVVPEVRLGGPTSLKPRRSLIPTGLEILPLGRPSVAVRSLRAADIKGDGRIGLLLSVYGSLVPVFLEDDRMVHVERRIAHEARLREVRQQSNSCVLDSAHEDVGVEDCREKLARAGEANDLALAAKLFLQLQSASRDSSSAIIKKRSSLAVAEVFEDYLALASTYGGVKAFTRASNVATLLGEWVPLIRDESPRAAERLALTKTALRRAEEVDGEAQEGDARRRLGPSISLPPEASKARTDACRAVCSGKKRLALNDPAAKELQANREAANAVCNQRMASYQAGWRFKVCGEEEEKNCIKFCETPQLAAASIQKAANDASVEARAEECASALDSLVRMARRPVGKEVEWFKLIAGPFGNCLAEYGNNPRAAVVCANRGLADPFMDACMANR